MRAAMTSLIAGLAAVLWVIASPAHAQLDHFKCYKIKKETVPFPTSASLDDQWVGPENVTIVKPSLWCNPVSKDGGPMNNPNEHLLCYKIKGPKLDPARHLSTSNQFGVATLFAKKPALLCVPGDKTDIP